ncbi:hypothetical protein JCM1840_004437 [Sporobolomyces johnsonii]
MDSFISMAKQASSCSGSTPLERALLTSPLPPSPPGAIWPLPQGYQAYEASQNGHQGSGGGEFGVQGSAALNSADNNRPSQGGMFDQDQAVQHASNSSGQDSGLFSQAMSFVSNQQNDPNDVDEDKLMEQHDQAYSQGNAGNMSSGSMGAAAALQAFKKFTQGGGSDSSSSGGSFQTQLIGQAMSEAAALFDQNGGSSGGDKQSAVNSAAATAMKLLMKSQMSGMVGGGNSGGLGSMLSMASKFM